MTEAWYRDMIWQALVTGILIAGPICFAIGWYWADWYRRSRRK